VRSAFAAKTLQELGYTDVLSMAGGFGKWKDEGRPWSTPVQLSAEQRNRYQRHVLLPEVGIEGQAKLLASKVLLLGAGGLGSPAAMYLAAAGVGTIGIVDMDVVDASNLQRQILHNLDRVGERKVDSAKKTLTMLNPDVDVVTYDTRL
jgi:molybdopterin/thiamine biosynthesis adenylyltransferase